MRKKIVSLILALLLASLPVLLYGAAATITSRNQISLGNFAAATGIVTLTSGDTIATGLSSVIFFSLTRNPATAANPSADDSTYNYTVSGGTVTVRTINNALRYRFFAIGGP